MGLVVGGVEIDRDPPRAPAEASLMPLDHARREFAPHRIEGLDPDLVFKPRDRRLRGERVAHHRVAPEQQLVNGIVGEPVGIVGIGMATRDTEDPLGQQVPQRVPDLAGLPGVDQTLGEPLDHPVLPLCRLEQDGPTIGTRVLLIERGDEGCVEEIREEDSLWYRVVLHASASVVRGGPHPLDRFSSQLRWNPGS